MKFFDALLDRFNIKLSEGGKTALIIIVGLIMAALAFSILKSSWNGFVYQGGIGMGGSMPTVGMPAPSMPMWEEQEASYVKFDGGGAEYAVSDAGYGMDMMMPTFSARNAASISPPMYGYSTGNTAEQFEVSDYSATIETNNLDETCSNVASLKTRGDVIFESATEYDQGCYYTFKAEHGAVPYILEEIKALNPRDLSENTYTIKQQLDDFTSEADILEKKLAAVEETLTDALAAYEEVARLAAQSNDAEALARVVSSKVATIERLTQERINVSQQLEYLARAKEQQADKLNYAYFSVSVYESQYIDGEGLADSWKAAVQRFFYDANNAIQGITVTLISLTLWAVQYLLYFLLLVVIVKYGWRLAKYIWQQE